MLKDEGCFWKFPWGCVKIGRLQDITPTSRAFLRHIEDTQDFACSFSRHGKRHMERLDRHRTLTVNMLCMIAASLQMSDEPRKLKVKQKTSGTFRSKTGADVFHAVRSMAGTAWKGGQSPLEAILALV